MKKGTTLLEIVIVEKAVHVWEEEGLWEISVPSAQFCCEPLLYKLKSIKEIQVG